VLAAAGIILILPLRGEARTVDPIGIVCALGAGAWLKLTLVTRAAFNQGFALARLPVRGTRRTG
jgi:threonine/homoserine efflux transporter RhtA